MSFYYYKVHHWVVASTILLPELPSTKCKKEGDVFITEGRVPMHLPDHEVTKKGEVWGGAMSYEISGGTALLFFKGVGRFLLDSNNTIVIDKLEDIDYSKIRLYLMGTCLGFSLIRQAIFPFHGSAILTPYGTALFVGPSGWGKSTTAAKFLQEGHKLLTDDVCVIRISEQGIPYAYPSSFRIKLWEDSISELRVDLTTLTNIIPDYSKKQFYADDKLCQTAQPVTAIYALWPDDEDILKIEPLVSHEKLSVLANNTFRLEAVEIFSRHREHFDFCSTIAQIVPVRRLWRPVSTFSIDRVYQEVIQDLKYLYSHAKAEI